MIYEPAEDSFLLQNFVKKYAKGIVLDMGTGSGIQAKTASFKADLVIGLDISKDVIKYCEKNSKGSNIYFFKSNLFQIFEDNFVYYDKVDNKFEVYEKSRVENREKRRLLVNKQIKFDLIIFNSPYLPQELKKKYLRFWLHVMNTRKWLNLQLKIQKDYLMKHFIFRVKRENWILMIKIRYIV